LATKVEVKEIAEYKMKKKEKKKVKEQTKIVIPAPKVRSGK
jgi:hypothetical protein